MSLNSKYIYTISIKFYIFAIKKMFHVKHSVWILFSFITNKYVIFLFSITGKASASILKNNITRMVLEVFDSSDFQEKIKNGVSLVDF